jgi:hypothetical protein
MFDALVERHGPALDTRPFSEEHVARQRDFLPQQLLEFWREEGWSSYADGFLRLTEPDALDDVLDDWLGASDARAAILSTALGHLIIWAGGAAHLLNPHDGRVNRLTDDVEILFDIVLCDDDVLNGLKKDLYDAALPRLGRPGPDECFGFVPALALGGPETPENLQRVELREYLAILAELTAGEA